jgi:6-phosphofructokinase 2
MKKIVTITFSPSVDKSVSIDKMLPETKMKCYDVETFPGGGGINVARVLTRFNCAVTALFPANKFIIPFFEKSLKKEKVRYSIIESKNATRESIEVFEQQTKKQYRLVIPSNDLRKNEWAACLKALDQFENIDYIIVSGSLPKNAPATIFEKVAKITNLRSARLIIDSSGESLKNAVKESVYLLKPNLEEFRLLIGQANLEETNLTEAALKFLQKSKCENLVISLGSKGAMLFSKSETHFIKAPKVKVKSTVGAGDSMLAGLIYGLSLGLNLKECLQHGIAFGTATTLQNGTALCSPKDVEKLLPIVINQQ